MSNQDKLWEAICEVTDQAFSCSQYGSVGLEGHFSADELRKIADVLDDNKPHIDLIPFPVKT